MRVYYLILVTTLVASVIAEFHTRNQRSRRSECECGTVSEHLRHARLIGGTPITDDAKYSWHASINWFYRFICSGALINEFYVITAASCFYSVFGTRHPDYFLKVGIGINKLLDDTRHYRAVDEVIVHPKYEYKPISFSSLGYNIALVKLDRRAKKEIPICLPFNDFNNDFLGKEATVIGYGRDELFGLLYNIPQEAVLKTKIQCLNVFETQPKFNAPNNSIICTEDGPHKNVCNGDIGSPLIITEGNVQVLVGILIFDRSCGLLEAKYTSVSYFLDWILQNVEDKNGCFNQL